MSGLVKALVDKMKLTTDRGGSSFECLYKGTPFKVDYIKGGSLERADMRVFLWGGEYSISNTYTVYPGVFQIYVHKVEMTYYTSTSALLIRGDDKNYVGISVPNPPTDDFLLFCDKFRYYTSQGTA